MHIKQFAEADWSTVGHKEKDSQAVEEEQISQLVIVPAVEIEIQSQSLQSDSDETRDIEILTDNTRATARPTNSKKIATSTKRSSTMPRNAPALGDPPYMCEYCDHLSPTRALHASHRHRKHRLKALPYQCSKCDKRFDTIQRLERHARRPTCNVYPEFECEYCGKKCIGLSNYNVHLRFHKKQYPFVCQICAKRFMMATHLNNHVQTKHEHKRYFCEFPGCGKMFQTRHSLKIHVYVHLGTMPYRCDYCERTYPSKGRLRWHINKSHGIEHSLAELDSMMVAEKISITAEMKPILNEPQVESESQVECVFVEDPDSQPSIILSDINGSECLIESETDTSLPLTHLADSTASQTPVAVIPIRAIVPPALTPVVTLTTGSNKSPSAATIAARKLPTRIPRSNAKVRCDFCPKLFVNRSKMLNHRHMHEVNRRHYACPQLDCDRIYLSKQSCDLHYKQTHCKPEQFGALQCTVCHKHFAIAQTLEVHMRYHTRDFPFECELCGKKFAQKGHMTTHLQVRHNNLRYACTEPGCAKVFKNSISLRNHCFVHTGMPFRCAYCDKGYPQKSKLKVHISSKHNVEMSIDELEAMRKLKSLRTRHSFVRLEEETLEEVGQYECGGEDVEEDNLQIIEPKQQYEDFVEEIEVTL